MFIAPNGVIKAVCFRRPQVEKLAAVPVPVPPGVLGRCTAQQMAEMRAGKMPESAIEKACKAP